MLGEPCSISKGGSVFEFAGCIASCNSAVMISGHGDNNERIVGLHSSGNACCEPVGGGGKG